MDISDRLIVGWPSDADGRNDLNRAISISPENHCLTIAPTGAGKGTGLIIPNLLNYRGSVIVVDPKAENYFLTHKYRRDLGHKVFLIDPFGEAVRLAEDKGVEVPTTDRINVLDILREDADGRADNSVMLAEILAPPHTEHNHFWNQKAKELVSGFLYYLAVSEHETDRSLRRLSDILTHEKAFHTASDNYALDQHKRWLDEKAKIEAENRAREQAQQDAWPDPAVDDNQQRRKRPGRSLPRRVPSEPVRPDPTFAEIVMERCKHEPFVASQIAPFLKITRPEMASDIFSIATNYLSVMRSEKVINSLADATLDLDLLRKGEDITIYVVIPPAKLKSHSALLKAIIATMMTTIMQRTSNPELPTIFLLDECAQLGELQHLTTAITLLRGYGLRAWMFFQDLGQLERLYRDDWKTIAGNCGLVQAFGVNRLVGNENLSQVIGYSAEEAKDLSYLNRSDQVMSLGGRTASICRLFLSYKDAAFRDRVGEDPRRL